MKKTEAEWHPYPSEKPEEDGSYFATVTGQENYARICRYSAKHKFINPDVIAWAKLPKPYDKRRTKDVEVESGISTLKRGQILLNVISRLRWSGRKELFRLHAGFHLQISFSWRKSFLSSPGQRCLNLTRRRSKKYE